MPEAVVGWLGTLIAALEIAGASALIVGFVIATVRWFVDSARMDRVVAVERYRETLGRAILIGLEVLVAATVIKTVAMEPTLEGLGRLAMLIALRGLLGWTTTLEMTGRWPWQGRPHSAETAPAEIEPAEHEA